MTSILKIFLSVNPVILFTVTAASVHWWESLCLPLFWQKGTYTLHALELSITKTSIPEYKCNYYYSKT